jgi:hypothetical protein
MEIATYILFVLGCLGAMDILLYHSVSHGIRSHRDSRFELVVHSLRGPTYAALFLLVPNFVMQGAYFWLLITILVFDVGVSMVDFAIERASREFFGGLPTGEYILHVIMAMLFGALVTSVFYSGSEWAGMATQLIFEPAVPGVICGIMAIMVFAVFLSGAMDLVAAVRLSQESAHD